MRCPLPGKRGAATALRGIKTKLQFLLVMPQDYLPPTRRSGHGTRAQGAHSRQVTKLDEPDRCASSEVRFTRIRIHSWTWAI